MRKKKLTYKFLFIILLGLTFIKAEGQGITIRKIETNKSAHSNIAPFVYDSTLIFASNKRTSPFKSYFNTDGDYIYKLYNIDLINGVPRGAIKPFLTSETGKLNIGSVTISGDGKLLIACQNGSDEVKNTNGKRGNTYALYFSEKNLSGNWNRLKPLPIDTKKLYNVVHPTLSQDGNTLVFASDNGDGLGKFDLYRCDKTNGVWQEPKNLGNSINTENNELFPCFVGNTKLYFSSDGRNGFGGMDIFVVQNINKLSEPIPLEQPINSKYDDFSCSVFPDERCGYFASNRENKDDIFYFEQVFPTFENAQPQVLDTFCYGFAETSVDPDSALVLQYIWNFGDGGTEKGLEVEHCFVGPGQYKVFLNVVDPVTKEELYSVANYDLDIDYTQQVFITCPDTVKIGEQVQFDATNSKLGSLVPKDYFWIIDNKDKRVGEQIFYTFNKKGTFIVLCGVVSRENPNERMASTRLIVVE